MTRNRVTRQDTERIAALAQLRLNEVEIDEATCELATMLEYVAQLEAVDVQGVAPTTHATALSSRLRADVEQLEAS